MSIANPPISADGLTPAYITDLLRSPDCGPAHDVSVSSILTEPVGSGQMAECLRLTISYDVNRTGAPETLIAKLATGDFSQRELVCGAYRNEVRFYRDLAATMSVPRPDCHGGHMSEQGTEFVLLLDDMTPAVQGDQIAGCTPEQTRAVAVAIAGAHGPRWDDPTLLTEGCFTLPTDEDRELMESVLAPMADAFRERFTLGDLESATVDWLVREAGAWLLAPTAHTSLVHGDLRADNVLFAPEADAGQQVTIIDWQATNFGNPLRDIAFLLSTTLTVEDRRAHERDIVAAYHQALADHGVTDYTLDECWNDYVGNLMQAPLIIVFGAGASSPTERGDRMFATMLSRCAHALADLDPGALDPGALDRAALDPTALTAPAESS